MCYYRSMKRSGISLLLATLLFVSRLSAQSPWQSLASGLEWGTFHVKVATPVGDATLTVLRIDPQLWELKALSISETGDAQYAHWIFGKSGGYVAQHSIFNILPTAIRVDKFTLGIFGDGIDGEVATN